MQSLVQPSVWIISAISLGEWTGGSLQPVRREPPATRSGLLEVGAHTARLGCSGGQIARLFMHSVHRHWVGRRQPSAAT